MLLKKNLKTNKQKLLDQTKEKNINYIDYSTLTQSIMAEIKELSGEKRIGVLMPKYNELETKLCNATTELYTIKSKLTELSTLKYTDEQILSDAEYTEYSTEINKLCEDIINISDLNEKYRLYEILLKKQHRCNKYLESIQVTIKNCESDDEFSESNSESSESEKSSSN
jgi:hypothetical protein